MTRLWSLLFRRRFSPCIRSRVECVIVTEQFRRVAYDRLVAREELFRLGL